MKFLVKFFGYLFGIGAAFALLMAAGVWMYLQHLNDGLPDYSALKNYEPPVMTRVHAADGSLMAEYATQRRMFLPIQAMPDRLKQSFISAEDKNFYTHLGVDPEGIARAAVRFIQNYGSGRRPEGASTITQQVAKNFLLTNELRVERKIKEAILALRIEQAYTKDEILELYLNEIYFGFGAYGVAAASLIYFDKSVHELSLEEAAYLAALPKGPSNYHPYRKTEAAVARRNYVIDRMVEDGHVSFEDGEEAKAKPITVKLRGHGSKLFAAEYFTEEVRREVADIFGTKRLYEGGLSVRSTLDPEMQQIARKTLMDGLIKFDHQRGSWNGPIDRISTGTDWGVELAKIEALSDLQEWSLAVVLESGTSEARVGIQPERLQSGQLEEDRKAGPLFLETMKWARVSGRAPSAVSDVLAPGDVVYVQESAVAPGTYELRQIPKVSGALVAMDPYTGRVLALVGGFSFAQSEFNRATQAWRQPGSSFKPFLYAAALDNGYTPSSVVMDAPLEISQGPGLGTWRPQNYGGKFYGPSTLRTGIERSRNVMTVRLAQDMGMPLVAEYAKRFGIYDNMLPVLSMSLGAGETTVLRMTAAYATIANGGRKLHPTLIDRIQDRYGRTIYKHDSRICDGCTQNAWDGQSEPTLIDNREQVLDPMTAYQITSMMEGVVQRGTATSVRAVGRPVAGKTGTTNDEKDAWFVGYTPDLAVGVFVGFDNPKPMGRGATGGQVAAPIFTEFVKQALAEKPPVEFRVPRGLQLIPINKNTGLRTAGGTPGAILEAFKPGMAPPDSYSVIGFQDTMGVPTYVSPEAGQAVLQGTGGLY
ncbi:penicillin-binding protein 1A [Roseibium alexandrii]|uniref:Penicillin-binding protein 1A n=1 Tax=Roseibium alexandrii (strain DSM 17067 / NCIMB 14079 / DFL-11) TaxID=244592 RepID=A0A5E8H4K2_ROSAD|nr:penicillin-binding protein 1A [Roseibium alexandrii]EEE47064.1 penicillin-binding protein, 1A family [Roseibium alexandrii DFL-11]